MLDTGTVRLVILLGMFLYFAGDYNMLMGIVWGTGGEVNHKDSGVKGLAKGVSKDGINFDRNFFGGARKDYEDGDAARRAKMVTTIKQSCLPKLICELTSSGQQDQLSEMERALLNLIRDTSLSTMAEVTSKFHFAAHMGQLIAGIEGQGCHNFYPSCPLPGASVLNLMKKLRLR
ncbi:uncharacterized protein LOC106644689 isoform X2 [Copidosoma floridanum]|uniref:uncharacterized protein LOC106644689 isoform X2 n=1 Tax=Copidosoma floridanum TaxID=29053 RepID=UPI0006C93C2D|nr:uncharacterized protein LOC106644689 isoform X2 [Copidosoma floridanum]